MAGFALRRLLPGRKRREGSVDGSMTLIEHLYELRYRLTVALAVVGLTTVFGFIWYGVAFFGLPSLGDLLKGPYCSLPAESRAEFTTDGSCTLLATGAFDQFNLRLTVAMTAGVVLACPVWLYQIWAFITPGLYSRERRYALTFVPVAATLFISGAVLAYFVVTQALSFLLGISDGVQTTALGGHEYFGFILALLLIFGVSFELPLLIVMLNLAGIVSYAKLKAWRRGLVFGLFVFAAVATPGQDPFSMIALGVSLVILFELATQVTRFNDRRRERQRAAEGWDDWDPDAPSPIDTAPSEIDTAPSRVDTAPSTTAPPDTAAARADTEPRRLDDVT